MNNKVNELDMAELKVQMRQMYREIGYKGSLQALYEILLSGQVLVDVLIEEMRKGGKGA